MHELDGQHAPDGGDSGADTPAETVPAARVPRDAAVPDAETRTARALEYRERVEAEYAAHRGRHANGHAGEQPDSEPPAYGHGSSDSDRPGRPAHPASDGSGTGQETEEVAAPSAERGHSWPPPNSDRDRVRQLYRDYLTDMAAAELLGGRGQGTEVVGVRPDRSPGDRRDLPPSGDELSELEPDKKSRFRELLHEAEKEENLEDLHDAVEEDASMVQRWLSARPPEGHAGQRVPGSVPHFIPSASDHGVEGGDAASAVLVAGILGVHMVRWIDDKLRHGKEGDHVNNG